MRVALLMNAGLIVDMPHLEESAPTASACSAPNCSSCCRARLPKLEQQTQAYRSGLKEAGGQPGRIPHARYRRRQSAALPAPAEGGEPRDGLARDPHGARPAAAVPRRRCARCCKAAAGAELRLMIPMVTAGYEMIAIRALIDEEKAFLVKTRLSPADADSIGAMFEVPSLLFDLDAFCPRVDFVSIGSNDLCSSCSRPTARTRASRAASTPVRPAASGLAHADEGGEALQGASDDVRRDRRQAARSHDADRAGIAIVVDGAGVDRADQVDDPVAQCRARRNLLGGRLLRRARKTSARARAFAEAEGDRDLIEAMLGRRRWTRCAVRARCSRLDAGRYALRTAALGSICLRRSLRTGVLRVFAGCVAFRHRRGDRRRSAAKVAERSLARAMRAGQAFDNRALLPDDISGGTLKFGGRTWRSSCVEATSRRGLARVRARRARSVPAAARASAHARTWRWKWRAIFTICAALSTSRSCGRQARRHPHRRHCRPRGGEGPRFPPWPEIVSYRGLRADGRPRRPTRAALAQMVLAAAGPMPDAEPRRAAALALPPRQRPDGAGGQLRRLRGGRTPRRRSLAGAFEGRARGPRERCSRLPSPSRSSC